MSSVGDPFALWFTHVEIALAHQRAILAIEVPVAVHLTLFISAFRLEEAVVVEREVIAVFLGETLVDDVDPRREQLFHETLFRELFFIELNGPFGGDHVPKFIRQSDWHFRPQKEAVVILEALVVNEQLP